MRDSHRFTRGILLGLVLTACSSLTDVDRPVEFQFEELQLGHNIEESVDADGFGSDLFFLGQFKTPHACFSLRPSFQESGNVLTLRVTAVSTNNQCPTQLGAYRYTGAVRHFRSGTYEFRMIHIVPGQADQSYPVSVIIR
jgi:hypothetical protein